MTDFKARRKLRFDRSVGDAVSSTPSRARDCPAGFSLEPRVGTKSSDIDPATLNDFMESPDERECGPSLESRSTHNSGSLFDSLAASVLVRAKPLTLYSRVFTSNSTDQADAHSGGVEEAAADSYTTTLSESGCSGEEDV